MCVCVCGGGVCAEQRLWFIGSSQHHVERLIMALVCVSVCVSERVKGGVYTFSVVTGDTHIKARPGPTQH